ncbi:MAG TPA: Ig-like domain-containing protein, partial [Longimicrobiaceae bacterium]|nr:Ig-like domain-containing protein [Longimicrobiaceae bacterium]
MTFGATGTAGAAAGLVKVAGDGQSGPAGSLLPAPLVGRVVDGRGNPVAGAAVSWAATAGGGSLAPAASTTDAAGQASAAWTLGGSVGANAATASVAGAAPVTFGATATPGSAAALSRVAGDGQSAAVGTLLPTALVVRVVDARDNPVSGATVAWAVTAGGGSVSAATSTTGADGTAATRWTLGGAAGPQAVSASVGSASVSFGGTGTSGPATRLVKVSGDAQTGVVGTGLLARLVAQAADAFGNPVAGVEVTWTVASGGGTLAPATGTTGRDGSVSTQWTLGPTPGAQSVTASAPGLAAASFGAAATAGPVATVTVSPAAANLERGSSLQLSATVRDAFGNLLTDRPVAWSSGYPSGATVSSTGLVFGVLAGQVTITAAAAGKPGQSVVTVVPAQDAVPPSLTGLSFTPAAVDVTSADARIEFTVTATDAGSGVKGVNVALWRPNINAWAPRCESVALVSGTSASGTWKCTLTIVRGSEAGTYRVNPSLTDYNDNHRT